MMNARKATVPLFMAAILGAALVLSILSVQRASAAGDDDDKDKSMANTATMNAHMMKGQIGSIQIGAGGQPEWIQSGMWLIRMLSADPQNPSAQLVAKFEMVKPDGTAAHQHSVYNFNATAMTQEGNSTTVLKGTATVSMKGAPVDNVPVTIKMFNNAVIGFWIGPDKVDSHFGTGPIYGTISAGSKANAMAMKGMEASPAAPARNNDNNTSSNSNSTAAIKMTAQEVDETYRWSTSDGGINPTLKMTANADNTVQIANPTDEKHELVIESSGKELASSGDIAPEGSGYLAFKPLAPGTYAYHCEYHPDTMKGTIEVAGTS